ncbi:MAG TPA: ribosome small subunit-dependent GTPase A [Chloroflexota bacterium]|nr:ribosome small subunit-dependent GTPase A [Chloroflexota bacterium]
MRSEGGFYTVQTPRARLLCTLVKRLRRGERLSTNPLAIGDGVMVRRTSEEQGTIEKIAPRRNELARAAPGRAALKHVLVANLDLLLVVSAVRDPAPNLARLDRFLVIAEQAAIPAMLLVSKIDLGDSARAEHLYQPYRAAGYPVLLTSAATGAGVDAVRAMLRARVSAMVGPSGVGKSTLLNTVQRGLRLRAAAVSGRTGKGRHTTSVAELIALDAGGYVADTPGLRGIEPHDLDPEMLDHFFPEMCPCLGGCRFSPCTHLHEPGCAVRAAVASSAIAASRFDSYVKLYAEAGNARRRAQVRARKGRTTAGILE